MKQKEFAEKFDVTKEHLYAVLNKRVRPSISLAIKIETHMGILAEELLPELKKLNKIRQFDNK